MLSHKLREAIAAQDKGVKVSGEVEIDGMYAGGYVKPANNKKNRRDRRLAAIKTASVKLSSSPASAMARPLRLSAKQKMRRPNAARAGSRLAALSMPTKPRIGIAMARALRNQAHQSQSRVQQRRRLHESWRESFFSAYVARKSERTTISLGRISPLTLPKWIGEKTIATVSNGEQYRKIVTAAAKHPVSRQWKGYWQRRAA